MGAVSPSCRGAVLGSLRIRLTALFFCLSLPGVQHSLPCAIQAGSRIKTSSFQLRSSFLATVVVVVVKVPAFDPSFLRLAGFSSLFSFFPPEQRSVLGAQNLGKGVPPVHKLIGRGVQKDERVILAPTRSAVAVSSFRGKARY